MPKIVEIIGPSGSGKSTMYNALKNEWKFEYNWVPYEYLKYSNESVFSKLYRRTKRVLNDIIPGGDRKIRKTGVVSEWGFISHRNKTFLGDKYSEFKTELMDLIEEHCKVGYNGSDKRFNTIFMIMWSIAFIETVQSVKNDDDRYCILKEGEGLISRIMHLNSPSFDEEALKIYLSHIPFPDVLLFLDLDPETVLERIVSRERDSTLHNGMDEGTILQYTKNTQKLLLMAASIAEEAGTKVYKIDVSKPVEQSVGEIMKVLS